jgi:hypothetical protein
MNHFESRMIGGINSSMQNRITLVDERFIYKALGSFVADAHHPDRPSDRSAERLQTQILLEIFRRPTRHFMICAKIFVRWILSPLIGSSPVEKWAPPHVFLGCERLCRSNWFGLRHD